jgi:hypothetical protein
VVSGAVEVLVDDLAQALLAEQTPLERPWIQEDVAGQVAQAPPKPGATGI